MAAPSWESLSLSGSHPGDARVRAESLRWALACVLVVPPLAAILHHVVFYRATCMLNDFGPEYGLMTVGLWLSRDPSLWVAMLIALAAYQLGNRLTGLRPLAIPFVLAFLPLTLWIWDLPFTGRIICHYLHDDQLLLAEGVPFKSRYLYLAGAGVFGLHLARLGRHRIALARGEALGRARLSVLSVFSIRS